MVSPSGSHFLGSCSKRTKPGWGGLTVLQYAKGRLCGPVTGSVKVAMPNSGNRSTSCEQEEMHVLGTVTLACLPSQTAPLPEPLLRRNPEAHHKGQPARGSYTSTTMDKTLPQTLWGKGLSELMRMREEREGKGKLFIRSN